MMKQYFRGLLIWFLVVLGSYLFSWQVACAQAEKSGRFIFTYQKPSAPNNLKLYQGLAQSGFLGVVVQGIENRYRLPADVNITLIECDEASAHYDMAQRQITVCYELFHRLHQHIFFLKNPSVDVKNADPALGSEAAASALDVLSFIEMHEVGHALIHLLGLPVTGREEDAVDQLAALWLLNLPKGPSILGAVAASFGALNNSSNAGEVTQNSFWKEHSLDEQRMWDITCLLYGSNPVRFAELVNDQTGLPYDRAKLCPQEFNKANKAWGTILSPHCRMLNCGPKIVPTS